MMTTDQKKKQYNNNKKYKTFENSKVKASQSLVSDPILKHICIEDLNDDDAIDNAIKLLKSVKSINKQRAKLQSEGLDFNTNPLLREPRKLNIEADDELYKSLKTIYNPRNKKTQMIKFKNESRVKFLLHIVKNSPDILFSHIRGEAQLAVNKLYDDIGEIDLTERDYAKLNAVAKLETNEPDEPDEVSFEDPEFEIRAKAKVGIKTRKSKPRTKKPAKTPADTPAKTQAEKPAEKPADELIKWVDGFLEVPEFVENSKNRLLKSRYKLTVTRINELIERKAEIESDEYDRHKAMDEIKAKSIELLKNYGAEMV